MKTQNYSNFALVKSFKLYINIVYTFYLFVINSCNLQNNIV